MLAGAGTGKTRVLTTRIAQSSPRAAPPGEILAVTFTNKAAREMKERIGALVGGAVEGMPWLGTFHSIGARILRRHAELVGLKSDFTILDTDDQIRLIKQMHRGREHRREALARAAACRHDRQLEEPRPACPRTSAAGEAAASPMARGSKLYAAYQKRLKTLNAVRFRRSAARKHPPVPRAAGRARRISPALQIHAGRRVSGHQRRAVSLAAAAGAGRATNICCVGDDDQSIYGWRGAEVDNILRFEKDFPGAKIIRLERNYRSTANILGAASHLIAHNEGRLGKTLQTDGEATASKRHRRGVWDSEEEARPIGEEIEQLQRRASSARTTWRSWSAPPSRCANSKSASSPWG